MCHTSLLEFESPFLFMKGVEDIILYFSLSSIQTCLWPLALRTNVILNELSQNMRSFSHALPSTFLSSPSSCSSPTGKNYGQNIIEHWPEKRFQKAKDNFCPLKNMTNDCGTLLNAHFYEFINILVLSWKSTEINKIFSSFIESLDSKALS